MLLTTKCAGRPVHAASAEHAAWMVVAAAESLAAEAEPAARVRFHTIARQLLLALRSSRFREQAIRAASPVVAGPDGTNRRVIDLVASYGDDPGPGVQAATVILLASDWRPDRESQHEPQHPSSRLRSFMGNPDQPRSEAFGRSLA